MKQLVVVGCLACTVIWYFLVLFVLIRSRGAISSEFENVILDFRSGFLKYSCKLLRQLHFSCGLSVVMHCHLVRKFLFLIADAQM